jgi:hypothetical protein
MNREPRVLTVEEMVTVAFMGFTLLCWEAMPQRYVTGLEVPNGYQGTDPQGERSSEEQA